MASQPRILIVDDEVEMLKVCSKVMQSWGFVPVTASDGAKAIRLAEQDEFDLVLCDLYMPESDGIQVLEVLTKSKPNLPVIMLSAYGTIDRAVAAMKAGAFDFIEKPFEAEHLKIIVEKGLRQNNLYKERQHLLEQLDGRFSFDNIVGNSAPMRQIFEMVESIAGTDANVLITGESGTGKELIARSIHAHSLRKTKPFVPVNCSAFPENLFEAELFGYEQGAFTGANRRKLGLLEYANGGTFFLDEVCELSPPLQAKLLRVLQDQQLRHIGGNELIQTNVRLISASNRDMEKARADGSLRDDLYFRLNVINIHLPPLRERHDDIRLLAEHFLHQGLKSSTKNIRGFTEEFLAHLENYDWPGNVRELENTIERALTLAKGEYLTLAEMPPMIRLQSSSASNSNVSLQQLKQDVVEQVEREYLLEKLEKHKGNVTKIAEEAQTTRRNLHRLLQRYGLDANNWRSQPS